MAITPADDTQQALGALGGLICPRCRKRAREPAGARGAVVRCEADGYALVTPAELAESDGDPFLGATVADRFVILGRLGAGSMGTVYRARQEAMGRDVAVKILRSDRAFDAHAKARFTREAKAMSLLTSPHTVTVFDFGEIPEDATEELGGGSLYLAMEKLEGESLGTRLKRVLRLPIADAVHVARHALLSLAEAHEKGIVHRDLKPDNLFLTRAGGSHEEVCKVLDFGIAKVVSDSVGGVDALETQAGTVFGTPRYMSPEQAQGKPLDARSDIYALGVLLYQMLVGRAPFVDDDAVVVMARHIKTMPAAPLEAAPDAGIPAALSAVVMRALAKDPSDRPQTATAFIAELERALQGGSPPGAVRPDAAAGATGDLAAVVGDELTGSGRGSSRRGRAQQGRALALIAVFGVLALAGTGAAVFRPRPAAVIEARSGLDHAALARAQAAARTLPAEAIAPDDSPPPPHPAPVPSGAAAGVPPAAAVSGLPGAAAPLPSARRPKKYTRFE